MKSVTRRAEATGSRRLRRIWHVSAAGLLTLCSSCALVGYDLFPLDADGPADSASEGSADAGLDASADSVGDGSRPDGSARDASVAGGRDAAVDGAVDGRVDAAVDHVPDGSLDAGADATLDAMTDASRDDASAGDAATDACMAMDATCTSPPSCPDAGRMLCDAAVACDGGTCEPHPPVPLQHPTAPTAQDLFGDSIALQQDTLVVGAPYDDAVASDGGAAFVYGRDGDGDWLLEQTLYGSEVVADDHFGECVDLHDQRLVVGADHSAGAGSGALGSVYVYERAGPSWLEADVIPAPGDPVDRTQFGNRVAIHGDWIIVTCFTDTYLYHHDGTGWVFSQALGRGKASRLDIEGTTAVLSIDDNDDGQAFVYEFDGDEWVQGAELVSDDDEDGDFFGGSAVALEHDTILVSASAFQGSGPIASGAVYVFERSGGVWSQIQRLQAPVPVESEAFGTTVALAGDSLAVGVPGADTAAQDAGAVDLFVFTDGSWAFQQRIVPSEPIVGGQMGYSDLRLSQDHVAFSSEEVEVSGLPRAGAVEIVER